MFEPHHYCDIDGVPTCEGSALKCPFREYKHCCLGGSCPHASLRRPERDDMVSRVTEFNARKKRKIEEITGDSVVSEPKIFKKLSWNHTKCGECSIPKEKKEFFESCKICEEYFCGKCETKNIDQVPLTFLVDEDDWELGEFICIKCIERVKHMHSFKFAFQKIPQCYTNHDIVGTISDNDVSN